MSQVIYKIYIPFRFGIGNNFYKTKLTINEFDIGDVRINLHLDESGSTEECYLIASTLVEEDGRHHIDEIADVKIGNCVQNFFDGISKGLSNAAFFNVYNGDSFVVAYETYCDGWEIKTPYRDSNAGYYLDDELMNKAIEFANSKDGYLRQAFIYLKEGEYLVDIGRYGSAIIQFAVLTEYLINYQLRKHGMINNKGYYINSFDLECYKWWIDLGNKGKVTFSYSKYVYGLSKLGFVMDQELLEAIQAVYDLRNKIAHGYSVFNAFEKCGLDFDGEEITEFNAWDCLMTISNYMTEVYKFFVDNFKDSGI